LALLQEALADSQLQAVKAQLERRGLGMNVDEAQAVQLVGGEQLLVPFGQDAHLVWTRTNGQTAAVGLIRQGNKTLNISASGEERLVRFLKAQKVQKLLGKLREKSKFQDFEGKLAQKGKRVGKVRVLFDETNKMAIVGIAAEGSEKIAHQVRIKVNGDRDDEPEEEAEPAIQATACGQASGEAVATSSAMQPLAAPPGEGDFEGGYEGPQICTSQWGYDYLCFSTTPMLSLSLSGISPSLTLPQTFITQQTQAAFTIWNSGGGRLRGTVSVPVPFSIVSGGIFSLLPGQPQEVVVRFSSATTGSFSKAINISSNGGSKMVTATSVAHKVSFSPATLDFGSGLFVMREQCNNMGVCGLHTEEVGLPIEKQLTVKNEGTVAVSLTLSTAAPYQIVSVLPTLSPGQSAQVTLRFDPNESGSFSGSVQVGINGGQGSVSSPPLVGVAHKIEVSPAELNLGIVFVDILREEKLTVKNQGVTTVTVETSPPSNASPFTVTLPEVPLVLTPSGSAEATVQFTATTSGEFSHTVRLIINNSFNTEVPLVARAVTFEEFLQLFGTLFVPGSPNLFFDGFENLEISLTDFQSLAQELLTRQPQSPTPEDLEIAQALEELKAWLDDPAFEQKIQELAQQYPAFGTFANQIQSEISNLGLASLSYVQVLRTLVGSLLAPVLLDQPPILWGIPSVDIAILTTLLAAAAQVHPIFGSVTLKIGNEDILASILLTIGVGIITGSLGPGCGDACLMNVRERLRTVATTIGTSGFDNNFKGLLMEVFVAAYAWVEGWTLLNFSQPYSKDGILKTEIDIIAKRFIPGLGDVVAFIEVKSDTGLSKARIVEKLSNYADYIENVGRYRYPGDFHVAILIQFEQTSGVTVENALSEYPGRTPALVVYCVSRCDGFGAKGQSTYEVQFKNMTTAQAIAIVTSLGFIVVGIRADGYIILAFKGDPTLIPLLLMAWTMR
jgi:hypothetical protein